MNNYSLNGIGVRNIAGDVRRPGDVVDMIPGVNVKNVFKQGVSVLPGTKDQDYDIFDNWTNSARPGQRDIFTGDVQPSSRVWPETLQGGQTGTTGTPGQTGGGHNTGTTVQYDQWGNPIGGGGGGGGGTANLQALAQLGQSASILQSALDRLPGQLDIARGNINRQYGIGINELNSNREASENNYNTSTTQNQQGFRTNKNTINDQASQGLRGLSRILGSFGAVGSDMGLAGQAVADVASAQNAGAGQNFSQNQQALDTNWGNYRNQWDNEKRKRDDWKTTQMNQAEAQSKSTRQDLLSRLASIRGEEAAARGGSFTGAAQPFIDQANQLSGRIDELGRMNPTYTGNTPVYNAPALSSYSAGNGAVTALQERVQGGMNTPYLNALLGKDRERKIGL